MPRLNDTAALTDKPLDENSSHSISTCRIANGYLIDEHYYNEGTGECRSTKRFSPTPPRIIPGRVARNSAPDAGSPMKDAVDYLKSPSGLER